MKVAFVSTLLSAAIFFVSATIAAAQGAVAILLPGAGGPVPIDFLMRNVRQLNAAGVETTVATTAQEAVSAANGLRAQGRRSILVGMSQGGLRAAQALASSNGFAGAIFVSANYNEIRATLGAPSRLPTTLVVHHRYDECPFTPASSIPAFSSWARGRLTVAMFENRGPPVPGPCGPRGAHGYFLNDSGPVAAIVSFMRSH